MNRSALNELDAYTDYERAHRPLTRDTLDAKEGNLSFKEKRSPVFQGR